VNSDRLRDAMLEALALALAPGAPHGVNPRVGCLIIAQDSTIVGRGYHRGAGTAHAEVAALAQAGDRARGATAVVTLEPCRHVGRTGPCTQALLDAGVTSVVYAQSDPTPEAGGGADVLRRAGVEVLGGLLSDEATRVNEAWTFAAEHGRPLVTWKSAVSLDGRVAGANGGPTPITGAESRRQVHELRSEVDAIVVGTGTALADDPQLTVRLPGREPLSRPLRVVVGGREVPPGARVRDDTAPTLFLRERNPAAVLADLYDRGVRHVLLEGGPTLAAAFLAVGLIDRIVWYLAPVLLGSGPLALPAQGTRSGALALPTGVDVIEVSVVGEDVRVIGRIRHEQAGT